MHPSFVASRLVTAVRLTLSLALLAPLSVRAQDTPEARQPAVMRRSIGVEYSLQAFDDGTAPWHLASLSLGDRTDHGSVILRGNFAHRFGTSGVQGEVDAYPRIADGLYAYLNLGYSQSDVVFPRWRSGGELFASLPRAYEASLGYRQLRFGGTPVTLLTGSVGRYVGNYWFSLRPYIHDTDNGTSASLGLTARRYYEDADHYVGFRISGGTAPSDQVTLDQVARTSSRSASVQGSFPASVRAIVTGSLGADSDELRPGVRRNDIAASLGLKWRL